MHTTNVYDSHIKHNLSETQDTGGGFNYSIGVEFSIHLVQSAVGNRLASPRPGPGRGLQ